MTNHIFPPTLLGAINAITDTNPDYVTKDLETGQIPGTWRLLQSLAPPKDIDIRIQCRFKIGPAFSGMMELRTVGVFNWQSMFIVLGTLGETIHAATFESEVVTLLAEERWVGLQYTPDLRKGVVIFHKNVWGKVWGSFFKST